MTIALIIIAVATIFYWLSLLFPAKKKKNINYVKLTNDKYRELVNLRAKISRKHKISKVLIYSNHQIIQLLNANVKTENELISFNIHRRIVEQYGDLILGIIRS